MVMLKSPYPPPPDGGGATTRSPLRVLTKLFARFGRVLIMQHRTNTLAGVQQFERFVDLFKRHVMSDEFVDLELTIHVALYVARQFRAPFHTTERRPFPDPTRDQLERPRGDLFAGSSHTDDD